MRFSIYINEKTDKEVIDHMQTLKENGDNVSRFFINAAKEYLKTTEYDNSDIRSIVKEIIKEEYKGLNMDKPQPRNDTIDLSRKINNIYD